LDGVLQLFDQSAVDVPDALDFARNPGGKNRNSDALETALRQRPGRKTVVVEEDSRLSVRFGWQSRKWKAYGGNVDYVSGGAVHVALHADRAEAVEIVAQAPRYGELGSGREPQSVQSRFAVEVGPLHIVVEEGKAAGEVLPPAQQEPGQFLQRELACLNQVLVPGALHLCVAMVEFVKQAPVRNSIAQRSPVAAEAARQRPLVHFPQIKV